MPRLDHCPQHRSAVPGRQMAGLEPGQPSRGKLHMPAGPGRTWLWSSPPAPLWVGRAQPGAGSRAREETRTPRVPRASPARSHPAVALTWSQRSHRAVSWSSRASIPGPLSLGAAAAAIPAPSLPNEGGGIALPAGRGAGRGDPRTRAVAGSLRRVVAGAPQGGGPRWGSR
jgi:hypothetical protein